MRTLLSTLLLIASLSCFAQNRVEYANSIQGDTSVKWAAIYNSYINLTPANPNFNIRNFFVNRMKKTALPVYKEDPASFAVLTTSMNYEQFKMGMKATDHDPAKMNCWFRYDNKPNASEDIFTRETNDCDTCVLANKLSFFKVKQLLYYKDHRFHIRNILLSPVVYKKKTQEGITSAEFFETDNLAFDAGNDTDDAIPATAKFIARSCNNLVLLPSTSPNTASSDILTKDNWSLSNQLYKDISNRSLKAYNADNSIYPDPKHILDYRHIEMYKNPPDTTATYDSTGTYIGDVAVYRQVDFDSIYNFMLVQDLYFDFDKQVLYSKAVALVPRIAVYTNSGIKLGLTQYWGVMFPEEKKKNNAISRKGSK
jgi:hypothetical protein